MIDFEKLKDKKVYFENEKEYHDFLKECDMQRIHWNSEDIATAKKHYYKNDEEWYVRIDNDLFLTYGNNVFDEKNSFYYQQLPRKNASIHTLAKTDSLCIENIVRNKKTTIVFWGDGTKTLVTLSDKEEDNQEIAILWAYFIKATGTKTHAKKVMNELVESVKVQKEKKKK